MEIQRRRWLPLFSRDAVAERETMCSPLGRG